MYIVSFFWFHFKCTIGIIDTLMNRRNRGVTIENKI